MKKNRFSEEQIIRILKEAEQGGKEIRELSRHHGITEQTFTDGVPTSAQQSGIPNPGGV